MKHSLGPIYMFMLGKAIVTVMVEPTTQGSVSTVVLTLQHNVVAVGVSGCEN